jgi:Icc-related predicted phosphoesterase
MEDLPHRGFSCFNTLLETWKPAYMVHGHVHREYAGTSFAREQLHPSGTSIVNAYERYMLEITEQEYPSFGQTGSALYDLYVRVKQSRRGR